MTGLPPVDPALLPADVRNGSASDKQLYESALSFESMLTQQLATQLTSGLQSDDSSGDGSDDGSSSSDASLSTLTDMLPGALAQGITQAGGLGLAPSLYAALKAKP